MAGEFIEDYEFVFPLIFFKNNIPLPGVVGEVTVGAAVGVVSVFGVVDVVDIIEFVDVVDEVCEVYEVGEVDEVNVDIVFVRHCFSLDMQGPQVELISSHLENM